MIPKEWKKSSHSGNDSGCVEIKEGVNESIMVRDSKLGDAGPILTFTPHEWACFVAGVKDGELQ